MYGLFTKRMDPYIHLGNKQERKDKKLIATWTYNDTLMVKGRKSDYRKVVLLWLIVIV